MVELTFKVSLSDNVLYKNELTHEDLVRAFRHKIGELDMLLYTETFRIELISGQRGDNIE